MKGEKCVCVRGGGGATGPAPLRQAHLESLSMEHPIQSQSLDISSNIYPPFLLSLNWNMINTLAGQQVVYFLASGCHQIQYTADVN